MNDVIIPRIWSPNPNAVAYELEKTSKVPHYRAVFKTKDRYKKDKGFATVAAIPILFSYASGLDSFPSVEDASIYLYKFCEPEYKHTQDAKNRTIKLTYDFFREMHTYGLLTQNNAFGKVGYEAGKDLGYNVDFTATLQSYLSHFVKSNDNNDFGIQSTVRASFNVDYDVVKARRRSKNEMKEWRGQVFELSNRTNKTIERTRSGVWLLTQKHIHQLIEEITGGGSQSAGVMVKLPGFDE